MNRGMRRHGEELGLPEWMYEDESDMWDGRAGDLFSKKLPDEDYDWITTGSSHSQQTKSPSPIAIRFLQNSHINAFFFFPMCSLLPFSYQRMCPIWTPATVFISILCIESFCYLAYISPLS